MTARSRALGPSTPPGVTARRMKNNPNPLKFASTGKKPPRRSPDGRDFPPRRPRAPINPGPTNASSAIARRIRTGIDIISTPSALTRSDSGRIIHVEAHFKSRGERMSDLGVLIGIGELARSTRLASSALRYYERAGLLSPARRAGGRRHYSASSAEHVALIQLCQDAGFTLREIRALLATGIRKSQPWTHLVEAKLRELETRIAQAERAKRLVQHALACPHRNLLECSNFRTAIKTTS